LIGINTYQPAEPRQSIQRCIYVAASGSFENLDGAVNDRKQWHDLLTSPKFGFPANQ